MIASDLNEGCMSKDGKPNGAARVTLPASPESWTPHENVNTNWRHVCDSKIDRHDLEQPAYLYNVAPKLGDWDVIHIIREDRSKYFQGVVVVGGRDGTGGVGSSFAQMTIVLEHDIPPINRDFADGLAAGYSIDFNSFTRRHVPKWGDVPLNADGFPSRRDAIELVHRHSQQAARVTPRSAR